MAHLSVAFCVGILSLGVYVAEARFDFASVTIEPLMLEVGFNPTTSLTVTCGISSRYAIYSLAIEKFTDIGVDELAFVSQDDPAAITNPSLLPAGTTVSATVGAEPSELVLVIPFPGEEETGQYTCVPRPVDPNLNQLVRSVARIVTINPFDIADYVERHNALEDRITVLVNHVNAVLPYPEQLNYTLEIIELNERCENNSLVIDSLNSRLLDAEDANSLWRCEVQNVEKNLKSLSTTQSIFSINPASRYYLTIGSPVNFLGASDFCQGLGGALAEFADESEFSQLLPGLVGAVAYDQFVLIGLTRNGTGDIVTGDGSLAPFVDFFGGSPNGDILGADCVALVLNYLGEPGLKMATVPCDFLPQILNTFNKPGLLCEVPTGTSTGDVCTNPFSF